MPLTKSRYLIIAITLIGLGVLLRWQNLLVQPAYFDEGYHTYFGAQIWQFREHPAVFADGKLMIYYWLGLFASGTPNLNLLAVRLSMGLIAVLSASLLAVIVKAWAGRLGALIALALFAVLPFAVFYERMAMSDALANCLGLLFVWRVQVLIKRPTLLQGAGVGLALALLTLTKLSMSAVGMLLPLAIVLWANWRTWHRYFAPLVVAGVVIVACWLPMLVPIILSQNTDHPMTLVDPIAVAAPDSNRLEYAQNVWQESLDFVPIVWVVVVGITLFLLGSRRLAIFFVIWMIVVALPPILTAGIPASRYFLPIVAPLVLTMGVGLAQLKNIPKIGTGLALGATVVCCGIALPTTQTIITAPQDLQLSTRNYVEFQSWTFNQDRAMLAIAERVNADNLPVLATWWGCYTLYFGLNRAPLCLDSPMTSADLRAGFVSQLAVGESGYLVLQQYAKDAFTFMTDYDWQFVGEFPRQVNGTKFVYLWQVKRLS